MAEKEYIDRNELIDDFQNDLINLYFNGLKGTPRPKEIKIVNVIERIEDFPIADVQPVKHGRWSECYTDSVHYSGICTACKSASVRQLIEKPYEFCPRCGARMDLGDEKHE